MALYRFDSSGQLSFCDSSVTPKIRFSFFLSHLRAGLMSVHYYPALLWSLSSFELVSDTWSPPSVEHLVLWARVVSVEVSFQECCL